MNNEIIIFENQNVTLEVNMKDETVWLTQQQMAELFDSSRTNIIEHINNIYESNSLGNSDNISKSNKNMNKFKEVYKKNSKNAIKKKKTNNLNANKKQNLKKNNEKHMEKNKINKISEYEGKAKNKTLNERTSKLNEYIQENDNLRLQLNNNLENENKIKSYYEKNKVDQSDLRLLYNEFNANKKSYFI